MAKIEIEHPDVEPHAFVHEETLHVWRAQGWRRVTKARKAAQDKARTSGDDKE